MERADFCALLPDAVGQIDKGAFLVAGESDPNPMTIGWAQFGVVWGKPMVMVMVRLSRYTFGLMEQAKTFSVSLPKTGEMKEALAYCGKHSGREGDKVKAAGLSVLPGRCGGADGIAGCDVHFECRIVDSTKLDLDGMDPAVRARAYGDNQATPDGDPHVLYFGEVLGAYRE